MKFYDLSIELSPATITWPGERPMGKKEFKTSAITSRLDIPSHFGTHIDAPRHFLFNAPGVDQIDLKKLIGKARVISVKADSPPLQASLPARQGGVRGGKKGTLISKAQLQKHSIKKGEKILLKTGSYRLLKKNKFTADYSSLSLEAAQYLAKVGIDLVGIDYFGIEAKSAPGHPVHKALLAKKIVIIEGCDLSKVPNGNYNIAALPLKLKNGDGAPSRVVLWD